MIQTNMFDENSDLSTTYLGKTRVTREISQSREEIPNYWTRLYFGKIVG